MMQDSLPAFIERFSCFQLRVRFKANRKISFNRPWYFEPRYDLGVALKRSKHAYLFDLFFSTAPIHYGDKNIYQPTNLVIRVGDSRKRLFRSQDYLDIYVTLITPSAEVLKHFCEVLPQWSRYNFFKKGDFSYVSYQILDPKDNKFSHQVSYEEAHLDYSYFSKHLLKWQNHLTVNFTTPTTLKIDELLTDQIPYKTIIDRISRRMYELSLYTLKTIDTETPPYRTENEASLSLSEIRLPKHSTYKSGKTYDMAGVLGSIHYQVAYNIIDDYLLTIASLIHIGSFTQMGNGSIRGFQFNRQLFDQFIQKLYETQLSFIDMDKQELINHIKDFSYTPSTYKIIKIPKSDGSFRQLNIPHPNDVHLQKAAQDVLSHKYEKIFLDQNFAYRKGKGASQAIRLIQKWTKELSSSHYVLRCDIDNFFDTISISTLINRLRTTIHDPFFIHYVQLWIQSGIVNHKNEYELNQIGIPQGSSLSPLLANIYLHSFDEFISKQITKHFIRYADDIILLLPNNKEPLEVLQSIKGHLSYNYRLQLNRDFVVAGLDDTFSFLGIMFSGSHKLKMDADKLERLPQKIKHILYLSENEPDKIIEAITGMRRYYGKILAHKEQEKIDDILLDVYKDYIAKRGTKRKKLLKNIKEKSFLTDKYKDYHWDKVNKESHLLKPVKVIKPLSIDQKLKNQRKKHLKSYAQSYELVVIEKGAFIGVSRSKFTVKVRGKIIHRQPVKHIRQISIMGDGISTSSNLTKVCTKNNIQIMYYNYLGEAYASTHKTDTIKPQNIKLQLQLDADKIRLYMERLVINKIKNQKKLLKYYHKYYKKQEIGPKLKSIIDALSQAILERPAAVKDLETYRDQLFLYEARCARIYWKGFRLLCLDKGITFEKREHRGTSNIVNQMLNYGYAILESKVLRTIHAWQLDPTISYMHAPHQNKPTLCYDLMEQYRAAIVDRSILSIIGKREKIEQNKSGMLSLDTRKKIISKINERLFSLQYHKGIDTTIYEIMQYHTGQIYDYIAGNKNLPRFYKSTW